MDLYPQFKAWLDSLDELHRAEAVELERSAELPPWMVRSLNDVGLLTVAAEIGDGDTHVVHLLTSRQQDYLETVRGVRS